MLVKSENFITIQGWMRTELNLSGNDLLVYAIIYGFSQTENQKFSGSLQYLADWCGATKQGIQKNLKNLLNLGLIKKEEKLMSNNINSVAYYTTQLHGVYNSVAWGIQLSCTNNIDNNIELEDSNTILKDSTTKSPIRNSGKRFNPNLTDDVSEKSYDDIPVRKKKMNLYEKCQLEITNFTDDENLREALKTYLDTRLRIKDKPILGIGQWKGLLNTLGRLQGDKLKIVERATERGWASFFELKDYQYNKQNDIKRSVFAEDYGVKSVRPEDVEGGGDSGIKF